MIQYDITVYIGETMREKRLIIKCHDTGVTLVIRLATMYKAAQWLTEERDYTIPDGTTAILKIRKPDNTYVVADASIRNKRVICKLPPQACTAPGINKAEVQLFSAEGKRLTSATFEFLVDEECLCDCDEESKPWVDVLGKQVTEAVSAAASAKEDADRAAVASVNPPQIGDNGNWWVWDAETGAYIDTGAKASGGDIVRIDLADYGLHFGDFNVSVPQDFVDIIQDALKNRKALYVHGADASGMEGTIMLDTMYAVDCTIVATGTGVIPNDDVAIAWVALVVEIENLRAAVVFDELATEDGYSPTIDVNRADGKTVLTITDIKGSL